MRYVMRKLSPGNTRKKLAAFSGNAEVISGLSQGIPELFSGNPELASMLLMEGKCRDFTPAALRFFEPGEEKVRLLP